MCSYTSQGTTCNCTHLTDFSSYFITTAEGVATVAATGGQQLTDVAVLKKNYGE